MTYFILGFLAGGFVGVLTMCLCVASGKADKNDEK
ncbi:MAG: DUF3789 domain-containing protein [Oscillospiraceae bacterium]|nr:DUF3789 domain-containing protein [Oscillospiraceae bacterium]